MIGYLKFTKELVEEYPDDVAHMLSNIEFVPMQADINRDFNYYLYKGYSPHFNIPDSMWIIENSSNFTPKVSCDIFDVLLKGKKI